MFASAAVAVSPPNAAPPAQAQFSPQAVAPAPLVPMSWGVLRNSHEVIRSSMKLMSGFVKSGDVEGFKTEWALFSKFLHLHANVEDEAVFPFLQTLGGTKEEWNAVSDEHGEDHVLSKALEETDDAQELKMKYPAYMDFMEQHLRHEEKLMMPLTAKSGTTPGERSKAFADIVLSKLVKSGEFDWHVGFAVARLTKYGSLENPPIVAVRVYVHGLQHAATNEQWKKWHEITKENTTEEIWKDLAKNLPKFDQGMQG